MKSVDLFVTKRHRIRLLLALSTIASVACSSTSESQSSLPVTEVANSAPVTEVPSVITIEDLANAKSVWQETVESLGPSIINGGVGISDGTIFGVVADSYAGTVSIWNWDTDQFVATPELAVEDRWNADSWGIDNVQIVDLTGDNNDDVFVDYHLNDYVGKAFSQMSGSWNSLTFDGYDVLNSPSLSGSIITSYELTCLPSCADGPAIPLTYSWKGSEFNGSAVDAFGNTFMMTVTQSCSDFTQKDYEPYKLCDKGEGIRYLQQVLYDNGLLLRLSDEPVDGYFGAATEYSIKAYQFANDLPVTGTVEGQWYHDLIEGYNMMSGIGD